jgi:hypothetical protein
MSCRYPAWRAATRLARGPRRSYVRAVILGAHVILCSTDADADPDRVLLRDVLGLPHVDAGGL